MFEFVSFSIPQAHPMSDEAGKLPLEVLNELLREDGALGHEAIGARRMRSTRGFLDQEGGVQTVHFHLREFGVGPLC